MKNYIYLNGKKYKIESYKTRDELEYLEYLFIHSDISEEDANLFLDEFLIKNGIENISELSEIEKIILMLKIREISIGDELKVKYKCSHCCNASEASININNMVKLSESHLDGVNGLFEEQYKDIIQVEDIAKEDYLDELDMDVYEDIKNNIFKYIDTYNFFQTCKCEYCGKENVFNMGDKPLLFSLLSDESFTSLSKLMHILVSQGKLTREDVLNMTPLQRLFEHGLIEETRKEIERRRSESRMH